MVAPILQAFVITLREGLEAFLIVDDAVYGVLCPAASWAFRYLPSQSTLMKRAATSEANSSEQVCRSRSHNRIAWSIVSRMPGISRNSPRTLLSKASCLLVLKSITVQGSCILPVIPSPLVARISHRLVVGVPSASRSTAIMTSASVSRITTSLPTNRYSSGPGSTGNVALNTAGKSKSSFAGNGCNTPT